MLKLRKVVVDKISCFFLSILPETSKNNKVCTCPVNVRRIILESLISTFTTSAYNVRVSMELKTPWFRFSIFSSSLDLSPINGCIFDNSDSAITDAWSIDISMFKVRVLFAIFTGLLQRARNNWEKRNFIWKLIETTMLAMDFSVTKTKKNQRQRQMKERRRITFKMFPFK